MVLISVGLGIICVLLLVFIILQYITITAERDLIKSYKNTVEEFNQTINGLQDNYTDLMTEKHQLQNNFSSLTQKNLELETRVKDLTAEKSQLQRSVESLSQKNLVLESKVTSLSEELKKETSKRGQYKHLLLFLCFFIFNVDGFIKYMFRCGSGCFFVPTELKSWSDSRQYCRDRGADLIIINTEEKQVSLIECLLINNRNHTYSQLTILSSKNVLKTFFGYGFMYGNVLYVQFS